MILIFDIGNSNIKVGAFNKNDVLLYKWVINTNKSSTKEYYKTEIKKVLEDNNVKTKDIEGIAICSVVPEITNVVKDALGFLDRKILMVKDPDTKINLKLTAEEKKTRGGDILADITAGIYKYKENFITVDFGTAIVISAIGKDAEILGVSILPSAPIIINALSTSCSQLVGFELKPTEKIIGKTTIEALSGGIFWLMAEGINGMINKLKNEYGIGKVCFTGGMSKIFRDRMSFESDFEENLTLNGIYQIFKINKE